MAKLTLTDLDNLQNDTSATNAINNNNASIETAIENTLSRDGATPNTMSANLDMNGNLIVNLAQPVNSTDAARLMDLTSLYSVDTILTPGTTVDSGIVLFNGTGGDNLKSATQTGILKGTSGVLGTAVAGTDYYAPSGVDVAIVDGGTGASTESAARTNLGLGSLATLNSIGTSEIDDVKAYGILARNAGTEGDLSEVVAIDLTEETAPVSGDFLLGWESGGALRKFDVGDLPNKDTAINLLDYGVVGDGVSVDTVAIQNAITAAANNTLYLPPGDYLLSGSTASASLTLPSRIRLKGAGRYQTRIFLATDSAGIVGIDSDDVQIDGIGFYGASSSRVAWQRALVMRGVEDLSITNCLFDQIGDGGVLLGRQGFGGSDAYGEGTRQPKRVRISGNEWVDCRGTVCLLSKYTGIQEIEITNNAFRDSGSVAISIESEQASPSTQVAERTVITGNRIIGCNYSYTGGLSQVAWGISFGELAQDCVISCNVIDGVVGDTASAGILISTSPSQDDELTRAATVGLNTIRDITASSGRAFGILLSAGDTSATDVTVSGNVVSSCEDGIAVQCDATSKTLGYVRGITVSGNVVVDVTEFGIWTDTTASSGSLPLIDCAITGNVVRNSGSHGVSVFSKDTSVVGNMIKNSGSAGISLLSGCERMTITGNVILESDSSGILGILSNSVISDNVSMNNGQGGGSTYGCYLTGGGDNIVSGNVFSDDQGTATQTYGFRGNSSDRFINNDCIGNTGAPIFAGISSLNQGVVDAYGNRIGTASVISTTQSETISSGAVTINSGVKIATIDTEASASTDDLDTVTYSGVAGDFLRLRAANSARTVVMKDGTGNLRLSGDFSLDNVEDSILLQFNGTNLDEVARSDNGA